MTSFRVQGTSTTIGRPSIGERRPYPYRGDKPLEDEQAGMTAGALARLERRRERMARYNQARCGGLDKKLAAAVVGVSWNNAGREYESAFGDKPWAGKPPGHDWQPHPDDPDGEGDGGMRCFYCGATEAEAAEVGRG